MELATGFFMNISCGFGVEVGLGFLIPDHTFHDSLDCINKVLCTMIRSYDLRMLLS